MQQTTKFCLGEENMKIVLDVYGGDYAPSEILKGAVMALNCEKFLSLILVGKEAEIKQELLKIGCDMSRIDIINADEVITNDDVPTVAIKNKKNSSLVTALNTLKERNDVAGLVSAGSTGAVLAGGIFILGRIKGVSRPALAPLLPTVNESNVLLIDCGANVDCKPINLVEFAIMGSEYMKHICKLKNPRVALLSNGVEDKKGNELNKEAFKLLEQTDINFVGNMEARDCLSGNYDVLVTDGFAGNIALKSLEGTAVSIFTVLKKGIKSLRAKIGAFLLKGVFKDLKKKLDYNNNGGAPFLGVEKIIIKSHGASKAKSICASILQAKQMAESGLIDSIRQSIEKYKSANQAE
jgi:glycerol-3-phosphate acyltransferase PlsX